MNTPAPNTSTVPQTKVRLTEKANAQSENFSGQSESRYAFWWYMRCSLGSRARLRIESLEATGPHTWSPNYSHPSRSE